MEIDFNNCSDNIAIVVVGYNRLNSIKRLLESLNDAVYNVSNVPLIISIDCSNNEELYNFVENYKWTHGDKYLNIEKQKLGLKEHILKCGDLSIFFKAIILLEDDLYVSRYFYDYVSEAVEEYKNEDNIAGISLYRNEINGFVGLPFHPLNNGSDVFAWQSACTWGECWTYKMWNLFRNWLNTWDDDFSKIDMLEREKKWINSWGKYFDAYLIENNKFFIYPYISVCTNFSDSGTHNDVNSSINQVNLLSGKKKYNFLQFSKLVKYDIYFNNLQLFSFLGIEKNDLCIDFYGNNSNYYNKRYILSSFNYPYEHIKSYGLKLRPIELNVINNIQGDELFLYDTFILKRKKEKKKLSKNALFYLNQGFNYKFLIQIVKLKILEIIENIIIK